VKADLIYLASQSPRRRELLDQLGVAHEVLLPQVDETPLPREAARAYVLRVAAAKAEAGGALAAARGLPPRPVLAADTCVVLGRRLLGKPADAAAAARMLALLSGRRHRVLTGVALACGARLYTALSESSVAFAELDPAAIAAYVASGEPLDKAGAYAIQGRAAAFVSRLCGSHSGVMGLPLYETARLLEQCAKDGPS